MICDFTCSAWNTVEQHIIVEGKELEGEEKEIKLFV